jgi:hypothetical protein
VIREVPFEETEHYLVTRSFLEFPELAMRELFRDPDSPAPEEG